MKKAHNRDEEKCIRSLKPAAVRRLLGAEKRTLAAALRLERS
jgi:hypothetical protein